MRGREETTCPHARCDEGTPGRDRERTATMRRAPMPMRATAPAASRRDSHTGREKARAPRPQHRPLPTPRPLPQPQPPLQRRPQSPELRSHMALVTHHRTPYSSLGLLGRPRRRRSMQPPRLGRERSHLPGRPSRALRRRRNHYGTGRPDGSLVEFPRRMGQSTVTILALLVRPCGDGRRSDITPHVTGAAQRALHRSIRRQDLPPLTVPRQVPRRAVPQPHCHSCD